MSRMPDDRHSRFEAEIGRLVRNPLVCITLLVYFKA
jgi:hypothetical protein